MEQQQPPSYDYSQQVYAPGPQQQPPPPSYDYSQQQVLNVNISPSPQKQIYDPSPVPGQQVYYAPYPQHYAPGPPGQVLNVGPQSSSGPTMVGGFIRFSSRAISTTCSACNNQVGI